MREPRWAAQELPNLEFLAVPAGLGVHHQGFVLTLHIHQRFGGPSHE